MPSTTPSRDLAAAASAHSNNPAMARALAEIDRAFGVAAVHDGFKRRVRKALRAPGHPAVQARYGGRARILGCSTLDLAIKRVEHWHRTERKALAIAYAKPSGLALEVLAELRLILRWMRRQGMNETFRVAAAALSARAAA